MKLVYVDESGDTQNVYSYGKKPSKIFVLCAVSVDEREWQTVNSKIIETKEKLFREKGLSPNLELHTCDMVRRIKPFDKLQEIDVINIFLDWVEFLNKLPISIITSVYDKTSYKSGGQFFEWNSNILIQRIETSMRKNYNGDTYILFPDEGHINEWKQQVDRIKANNEIPSKYGNELYEVKIQKLVEDPIERDSKKTHLIQVADFFAYVVSQYYLLKFMNKRPKKKVSYFDISLIETILDTSLDILNTEAHRDNKYGIVHYPK